MPKKEEPFYRNCANRDCDAVRYEVYRSYDNVSQKKRPARHPKGGVEMRVLPPTMIRPAGARKKVPYRKGKRFHFKRCYAFDYLDKHTHKMTTDTCIEEKIYTINQRTLNCYNNTVGLLTAIKKGKKGKPSENRDKILAMLACSSSGRATTRVGEPLSARIISAAAEIPLNKTRNALSYLQRQHKIVCGLPSLKVVDEKQCHVPKQYLKTFRQFVKGEREERVFAGLRRLFGEKSIPKAVTEPEAAEGPFYEKHGRLYVKRR